MQTRFAAERVINGPAQVIYHLIADYREHHRPEGFLPSAFSDQEILEGGIGAGTVLRYTLTAGGRARGITARVTEPEPGRTLMELAPGIETTVTIEPVADRTRVRFDTILVEAGVTGLLTRLFAGRLLRPIYGDELDRLEHMARSHAPIDEP